MNVIFDEDLAGIPVRDNGEKLVSIKKVCPWVVIRPSPIVKRFMKARVCLLREGAARRLLKAQQSLPDGYKLVLMSCYRSQSLQRKLFGYVFRKIKRDHPGWSRVRDTREAKKFAAPVMEGVTPPHSTGGAVDITVLGPDGKKLDMGTRPDSIGNRSFTSSKKIPAKARKNRKVLIKAMEGAGFVNYPLEWWHWSYGDRYWAAVKKKRHAIYGVV